MIWAKVEKLRANWKCSQQRKHCLFEQVYTCYQGNLAASALVLTLSLTHTFVCVHVIFIHLTNSIFRSRRLWSVFSWMPTHNATQWKTPTAFKSNVLYWRIEMMIMLPYRKGGNCQAEMVTKFWQSKMLSTRNERWNNRQTNTHTNMHTPSRMHFGYFKSVFWNIMPINNGRFWKVLHEIYLQSIEFEMEMNDRELCDSCND